MKSIAARDGFLHFPLLAAIALVSAACPSYAAPDRRPSHQYAAPDRLPPHLRGAFSPVTETGEIARFILNPHGHVDGMLLKNGAQIHMPPHMGEAAAQQWRIGDNVRIDGFRGVRAAQGVVIRAWQLRSPDNGQILTDQHGVKPGPMLPARPEQAFSGRIADVILDMEGDAVGAFLDGGMQLRWHPNEQFISRPMLPGLIVEGDAAPLKTAHGVVWVVRELKLSGDAR